jgi:integrase
MPPKKRLKENKGLPKRWREKHGAYYYRVPPGQEHEWDNKKEFLLGKTLSDAYATWARYIEQIPEDIQTIADLFDRYALEVIPTKAAATQRDNLASLKILRPIFGAMLLAKYKECLIEPHHFYQYYDKRKGKTSAAHELQVFRHALTKAVEWGLIKKNPIIGQFNLKGRKPKTRDRYIEDWELIEVLKLPEMRKKGSVRMLKAYIKIKLMTALRRSDMLRIRVTDIRDGILHVQPHKTAKTTGKAIDIEITPELDQAIKEAIAARPLHIAPWLFCTRDGTSYIGADEQANGFDSMWQRFMARVLKETKVTEYFCERDLRAKCATDQPSLEAARKLLNHTDLRTTERWYRRKPERVKPGKSI